MKKVLSLIMAICMIAFTVCALASCAADNSKDLEYIKNKGKLVVGITDFAPMDYQDESGKWIGFDADLARLFAEYIGVDVEFQEIEWDNKIMELNGKSIDCVWNGMTLTDEVKSSMNCGVPYLDNAQVVVIAADKADDYKTVEACKSLRFAVENGSAGMDMAEENGFTFTAVIDQATALMEVAAGTSDAAIIDSLMAAATIGAGTSYENLTYILPLNSEEYGVGFRKGSDVTDVWNEFFAAVKADGRLAQIAEKYGIPASLLK